MPRIVPVTALGGAATNDAGCGGGCAEHGGGLMAEPDELLTRSDYLLENSRLNVRRALAMVEQLRKDNEQLRAALAAQPQPVTLDYDNGYKQGFRDGLRQQGHDVDRLVAEAVAGPPAPTGDDDG